jgi:orotate phosphoribosyltransferase
MNDISRKIASQLLQIKAIQLSPQKPFTWASGRKSPIYCDNRLTLSYPSIRNTIRNAFVDHIKSLPGINLVSGVATAGIPHAALAANELDLPMVYVRSKPKSHGKQNLIEGHIPEENNRVMVIEDLISTGGSSLKAVDAMRMADTEVVGVMAIFTYGFDEAYSAFREAGCKLHTLCNYEILLEEAVARDYINKHEREILAAWRKDPVQWHEDHS